MHYLIVTDMTGINDSADISCSLANLITDLLPLEKTRISLFCYGYKTSENGGFQFSGDTRTIEGAYVHEVIPPEDFSERNVEEYRDALIQTFFSLSANGSRRSPHGHALLASMQYMERVGAQDANACVIMISDGERATDDPAVDNNCKEKALAIAQKHHWPIYTIEWDQDSTHTPLPDNANYDDLDSGKAARNEYPRMFMTEVAWKSGAVRVDPAGNDALLPGTWVIGNESNEADTPADSDYRTQTYRTALDIMDFRTEEETFDSNGTLEIPFTVSNLTCEYLFFLQNTVPDDVFFFFVCDSEESPVWESGNENILHKKAGDSYSIIRLVCPTPGDYVLRIKGKSGTQILTGSRTVINPELKVKFSDKLGKHLPQDEAGNLQLPEGDPLSVTAECWYGDTLLTLSADDKTYSAQLLLQLDTKDHTSDHYKKLINEFMMPEKTNWSFKNGRLPVEDILPSENTGCYQLVVNLIEGDANTEPLLTERYYLTTVPASADALDKIQEIELGNIPPLGTKKFSLKEQLNGMPDRLMFSVVGVDNAGMSFHLLDSEKQACKDLSGAYRSLTLQVNDCVGEYRVTLTASCYAESKSFYLVFNVIEPEKTDIVNFDLDLYDRHPSKAYRWLIRDYACFHEQFWEDGIKLISITGYDPQIVSYKAYDDASGIFYSRNTGVTSAKVTLDTGAYRKDINGNLCPTEKSITVNVTVHSMDELERPYRIASWIIPGILVIAFLIIAFTGRTASYTLKTSVDSYVGKKVEGQKKSTFGELCSNWIFDNAGEGAECSEEWKKLKENTDKDNLRDLKEKYSNLTLIPISRFSWAPILVTKIPKDNVKVIINQRERKRKRSYALVFRRISLGHSGSLPTLTIKKHKQKKDPTSK